MPVYAIQLRKQISQSLTVEAKNAAEAKKLAREGSDRCDWDGLDEIYPQPTPTVMSCVEDI